MAPGDEMNDGSPTPTIGVSPKPTFSPTRPPPADSLQVIGAVLAIVLALAAAVVGYRIIRGGRGL